jgi:hypothetical protein
VYLHCYSMLKSIILGGGGCIIDVSDILTGSTIEAKWLRVIQEDIILNFGFEVLTGLTLNVTVFWVEPPSISETWTCSLLACRTIRPRWVPPTRAVSELHATTSYSNVLLTEQWERRVQYTVTAVLQCILQRFKPTRNYCDGLILRSIPMSPLWLQSMRVRLGDVAGSSRKLWRRECPVTSETSTEHVSFAAMLLIAIFTSFLSKSALQIVSTVLLVFILRWKHLIGILHNTLFRYF